MRVIRVAQDIVPPNGVASSSTEESSPSRLEASRAALARRILERVIEGLEPEVARKLSTLLVAGRDAVNIATVPLELEAEARAALIAGQRTNAYGFADCLCRGYALARAAALDIESPLASWRDAFPRTLDERVWSSFGRQLARSAPGDWQCLGFAESGVETMNRLLLKLDGHAWWSFAGVLDRPSSAWVEKHARGLASRRATGLVLRSLTALVPQLPTSGGPALRRAARAVQARVGI